MPSIYSLRENHEFIQEYETEILPKLTLGETPNNQPKEANKLRQENTELKEQLVKLTKLLTEKLNNSP